MKICKRCNLELPDENFSEYKRTLVSGEVGVYRMSTCKKCKGDIRKQKYHSDPEFKERVYELNSRWRVNNPEKIKECARRAYKRYYDRLSEQEKKEMYARNNKRRKERERLKRMLREKEENSE